MALVFSSFVVCFNWNTHPLVLKQEAVVSSLATA